MLCDFGCFDAAEKIEIQLFFETIAQSFTVLLPEGA
jgi:hypothetical protein